MPTRGRVLGLRLARRAASARAVRGRPRAIAEKVVEALRDLKEHADSHDAAIESTTRQLARYRTWWTSANGFFGGGPRPDRRRGSGNRRGWSRGTGTAVTQG